MRQNGAEWAAEGRGEERPAGIGGAEEKALGRQKRGLSWSEAEHMVLSVCPVQRGRRVTDCSQRVIRGTLQQGTVVPCGMTAAW